MSKSDAKYPILYTFRRCPYAMRARMALWSSGVTVELREIVLGRKPAALLEASPKGTVPVLVGSGTYPLIEQSLEIMIWALEQDDPEGWLLPDRNASLQLISENDTSFKKNLDRYKYPERFEGASAPEARDAALDFLRTLEETLKASQGPFLLGSRFTLVDAAIFPFIRQFANVDDTWFEALPLPRLQSWLALCLETELFERIMEKFKEWKPESECLLWGRLVKDRA